MFQKPWFKKPYLWKANYNLSKSKLRGSYLPIYLQHNWHRVPFIKSLSDAHKHLFDANAGTKLWEAVLIIENQSIMKMNHLWKYNLSLGICNWIFQIIDSDIDLKVICVVKAKKCTLPNNLEHFHLIRISINYRGMLKMFTSFPYIFIICGDV